MHSVKAYAPINIALIKYWGKRDSKEVLPYNESLSVSLEGYGTTTMLEATNKGHLEVFINDHPATTADYKRVLWFLRQFEGFNENDGLRITSVNTVPTAAGFASSASAYAALATSANAFFKTHYDHETLTAITRKGSGSAARSLLGGLVQWRTDGGISQLHWPFDDVVLLGVSVNETQKATASKEAMAHCVKTSSLYTQWLTRAANDADALKEALKQGDFSMLGEIAERNAAYMHHTMEKATPPIIYLTEASHAIIEIVRSLRAKGIEAYATMDAGPNVKIICRKSALPSIKHTLIDAGYKRLKELTVSSEGARILE